MSVTNDKLIQVKDLKKHYNKGAIKALDGVSLALGQRVRVGAGAFWFGQDNLA